eukprot:CAMPEP_0180085190 /NCGR_PEP_ID=MMETSP0985-20121206/20305_1 /TAXON_ID=483367 /ORGANISM="non described non described, Strain CCMP 2436" /LENGTH=123 /DNA_ID=CAMNT_0022018987 /DNA_START=465 /DNA_END=836 /DNA_ORIENTATION=+
MNSARVCPAHAHFLGAHLLNGLALLGPRGHNQLAVTGATPRRGLAQLAQLRALLAQSRPGPPERLLLCAIELRLAHGLLLRSQDGANLVAKQCEPVLSAHPRVPGGEQLGADVSFVACLELRQ